MYLSLRLASAEEVTREEIPIILDETFAYFDEERLKNILNYLSNEYSERQIIIFTCSRREENVMVNLRKKCNSINL